MAGFFGFGAFSTPVGQLIEKATDNGASAGNLALHLQICDVVNETDSGPKEAVAALRKRFTGNTKNFHIINLTLTVLETCVKNCGLRFHHKIAQKEFLADLLKVIQPKNNPPTIVKERVLGQIQYWADAFKGKPQLIAVEEMYEQMKAEGVEFPPIDLDSLAPIETPTSRGSTQQQGQQLQLHQPGTGGGTGGAGQASSGGQGQQRVRRSRGPIGPLPPEQVAKMLSELDLVRKNMDIMSEIMNENEPGKENQEDMELLDELNRVVHNMQLRVAGLIERCQDEIVLESTLVINDDLNTLFVRYDRWLRNSEAAKAGNTGTAEAGKDPPTHTGEQPSQPQVATTSLMGPESGAAISYPNMDDPLPPSYEAASADPTSTGTGGIGQLIDLGTDIKAPPPQSQGTGGDDIVAQLAQLGVTTTSSTGSAGTNGTTVPASSSSQAATDEFDMFAESRTAYGSQQQGSTYDDNMIQQNATLSSVVRGRGQEPSGAGTSGGPSDHPYSNLTEWLANTDLSSGSSAGVPPPESATSAEFDQFLAQRASKGETLPAERPRPQMQKAEDQSDELFSL